MRADHGASYCGPEGKFFEPKPPTRSFWSRLRAWFK
jgi:hypothetical protein